MAQNTPSSSYQIPNNNDPTKPFISLNIPNAIKLNATNYLSWKMQIEAILIGHDLFQYIDGSLPSPPKTIILNETEIPNPEFTLWTRQDKLICGALIGTLSTELVPLVSQAKTSKQLWDILTKTYATPSRGHIKQLREQLHRITKGNRTITEFMQAIKACADQLAALGRKVEHEDLIDRVLAGLDESNNSVIESVNARDTPISFEELHEKLINKELSLLQNRTNPPFPATAFAASSRPPQRTNTPNNRPPSSGILPNPNTSQRQPRPFLGKCQWCRTQGHVVTQCTLFNRQFPNAKPPTPSSFTTTTHKPTPQAHNVTFPQSNSALNTPWLLDSGASHHVTTDLNNLSLHAPYDGTEELIVGDGSHNGGISIPGAN